MLLLSQNCHCNTFWLPGVVRIVLPMNNLPSSNCPTYCRWPSCMGTPHLFISLTNRSSAKNCWLEVIKGKKSGQLAKLNLVGKLAERGAESSLWKLEAGRSRIFGIAQTCDACVITTCGCGSPQGWGIPTWLLNTGRRSMGEITKQQILVGVSRMGGVGNPLEGGIPLVLHPSLDN